MIYPATLLCDFYKISHRKQYPEKTQRIYATWTPRTSRKVGIDKVVFFGLQGFIKEYLIEYFSKNFFYRKLEDVVAEYKRVIKNTLGEEDPDASHIIALHKLGYLPIEIKALPEGTLTPIKVPMFTIENTVDEFFWVTNYLETLLSCMLWQPMTSATISLEYRKILDKYALETVGNTSGVKFCGHDFSMRGMSSLESAKISGAGHLLSFVGTDTIPSILYVEEFYNANIEEELIGTSIPATEHSVQCCYGQEEEINTFKRLITEVYPKGIVSVVSDTWDLWKVLTEYLPELKSTIMNRDGKLVIRPDSGDPVKILCGDIDIINLNDKVRCLQEANCYFGRMAWNYFSDKVMQLLHDKKEYNFTLNEKFYKAECVPHFKIEKDMFKKDCRYVLNDVEVNIKEIELTPANKGVVQLLWETFGGTTTKKGYKLLDQHIGCIYGDAITLERCKEICEKLKEKGFASTNMVYGMGSYSFQFNTRDTFGFAMKTTYAVVDGEERFLFKNPITDNGVKKSQKGRVAVVNSEDFKALELVDGLNKEEEETYKDNLLQTVFRNGHLLVDDNFNEIRQRVQIHL